MLSLLSYIPKGNITEHTALVKLLMLWKTQHLFLTEKILHKMILNKVTAYRKLSGIQWNCSRHI